MYLSTRVQIILPKNNTFLHHKFRQIIYFNQSSYALLRQFLRMSRRHAKTKLVAAAF